MTRGLPSLVRSRCMVCFTALVKGSAASSHTRSSSSSAERTRPGDERRQQGEFLGTEVEALTGSGRHSAGWVEGDVLVGEGRGYWRGGPAAESPDTGDQLGERERLGEVVVRAQSETFDAVFDRIGGGEHQDPNIRAVGDDLPTDVVTVHAG